VKFNNALEDQFDTITDWHRSEAFELAKGKRDGKDIVVLVCNTDNTGFGIGENNDVFLIGDEPKKEVMDSKIPGNLMTFLVTYCMLIGSPEAGKILAGVCAPLDEDPELDDEVPTEPYIKTTTTKVGKA
jgi:hypothetical protein